jgi:hypothetical protein
MTTRTIGSIIAAAGLAFATGRVVSQPAETGKPTPQATPPAAAPADEAAKDEAAEQLESLRHMLAEEAAIADEHQLLEKLVGTFKTEARMFMVPGEPPLTSHGTGKAEWILGKRFVKVESSVGQGAAGKELESESLTIYGFDTRTNKYTVIALDTMGTYWVTAQGDYDANTKELKLSGSVIEQGQTMKFRWVVKFEDTRHTTTVSINIGGDEWMKAGETVHTMEAASKP